MDEECIPKLVITKGGKDALTVSDVSYGPSPTAFSAPPTKVS